MSTVTTNEEKETNENIDWQSKLTEDEVGREGSTNFVYVKGLRRLAKIKGIQYEQHELGVPIVLKNPGTGAEYPFVQVKYSVTFKDGTTFSDVADAHTFNVQGDFSVYPTAIAGTRAEARALKKALGIDMVSKEELGAKSGAAAEQRNESTPAQEKVIKNQMKLKGVKDASEVISKVCGRENVFALKELTFVEAQQALVMLNKMKVPK